MKYFAALSLVFICNISFAKSLSSIWRPVPGKMHGGVVQFDMRTVNFNQVGEQHFRATVASGEVSDCVLFIEQVQAEAVYDIHCSSPSDEFSMIAPDFGTFRKGQHITWYSAKIFVEQMSAGVANPDGLAEYR